MVRYFLPLLMMLVTATPVLAQTVLDTAQKPKGSAFTWFAAIILVIAILVITIIPPKRGHQE